MEAMLKTIAGHPFFEGLAPDLVKVIAGFASQVQYDAGQMIYREGEDASQFHLITFGKVAIEIFEPKKGSRIIQTIGRGDVLGWSWLFPPYKWRFDARALELTRAIALDGRSLREKAETDHHLGYELLKRFSRVILERLHAMRLQLLDVYGD
ncbi:MAG: cyclic nucleotide-binding domain-containing protein [Deltaproteobacteria bacterium]|nr:cyclic nucleotide-binding domain-containing protein [Deltaproteobacteria bacterium]